MTPQELTDKAIAVLRMTEEEWAREYGEPVEHGYGIRETQLDGLEFQAYAAGLSFEEVKSAFSEAFSRY